jgi:hypothetical protein
MQIMGEGKSSVITDRKRKCPLYEIGIKTILKYYALRYFRYDV